MGRVVKNATLSEEQYVLGVPAAPSTAVSSNGHASEGVVLGAPIAQAPKAPVAPPAPSIDWDALRAEAASIIDEAAEGAQSLVSDAGALAKTIVEEGVAQRSAVTQAAHNQGFEVGREAGRHSADQEMNEMVVTMRGLVDMARAERHKIIESAEPEIVKLAMGIAERIVHKVVDVDRDIVVEMTKAAIQRLLEREVVTVRVHPADLERMKEHRDDVLALGDVKHMRIIEDQRVDRGGVIVETESGSVDAKIATQLDEAKHVLHVEDDVVVAPIENGALLERAAVN
ncbi:MAG TPA: FliH/SctL family protein [Candidatus Binatia bacterium]|nr:FliH/SctL family protein [Candidatus Binatia bacterium]